MLWIEFMSPYNEIALRRMPQNIFDSKTRLVQVMALCRQATSHYLNQYWSRCMSPYNVTWPQWVGWINILFHRALTIWAVGRTIDTHVVTQAIFFGYILCKCFRTQKTKSQEPYPTLYIAKWCFYDVRSVGKHIVQNTWVWLTGS